MLSSLSAASAFMPATSGDGVQNGNPRVLRLVRKSLPDFETDGVVCTYFRGAGSCSILGKGIVGIAIQPTLTWLRRGDYRMFTSLRVLRGVTIRRVVTTQRRAARLTGPQMHPSRADLHALFAFSPLRMFDSRNRLYVRTSFFSHDFLLYSAST